VPIDVEPIRGFRLAAEPGPGGRPYEEPDVTVTLDIEGVHASATLPWYSVAAEGMAQFFREIDRDWRGWEGEKLFGDAEDTLRIAATHDGLGHVRVWISFWDDYPHAAGFFVSALLPITVGEAPAVAEALEAWTAEVWPA
jgi:hypothetical protein